MTTYGLNLKFGLRDVDFVTTYNLYHGVRLSVELQLEGTSNFLEIAQTESKFHAKDISFEQKISISYRFDKVQRIKIILYAIRDSTSEEFVGKIGEVLCDIPVLLANGGNLSLPIHMTKTLCDVSVQIPSIYRKYLRLKFAGCHLHAPTICPGIAAYFVFLLVLENRTVMLYRSEVLSSKNPDWIEFSVPLYILQFYQQGSLQLHVYNQMPNHEDILIGYTVSSLIQLQRGPGAINSYMLLNHEGRRKDEKMSVDLQKCEQIDGEGFFDIIMNKTALHVGCAIDFTASNGNPNKPESLHYIHPHKPNPYTSSILRLVPPFLGYSSDPLVTALGFGAKIQPDSVMSNCFFLDSSGVNRNGCVRGLEGLLDAYRKARIEVFPFAPTELADVIYHMSTFAKAAHRLRLGVYYVLVILTDGDLGNVKRTRDAIVDACGCPLSVITVGIGENRDFSSVKSLESPTLKHSDGRVATRQVLSFFSMEDVSSDDAVALLPFRIQQFKTLYASSG